MAKQVFENKDLVRLIYGFGPEHRTHMKKVCYSIQYPIVDRNNGKALLSPVPNYLKYNIGWVKYVQFFLKKRCHCCSRHCYKKPNIYLEKGMIVYDYGDRKRVPECKNMGDCDCDCRHACRIMIKKLMFDL